MILFRNNRERHILYFMIILTVSIGVILFVYQIMNRARYRELSESNRVRMVIEPAPRGKMFSSDSVEIASVRKLYSLYLDIGIVKPDYIVLREIAELADMSIDSLSMLISNGKRYGQSQVLLKSDTDMRTVSVIEENSNLFPGILIKGTVFRYYPFKDLYTHPIGYVGNISNEEYSELIKRGYAFFDFTGKSGIEAHYDSDLRGINGIKYYEIDINGRIIGSINEDNAIKPEPGNNLYTSLNHTIQQYCDSLLDEYSVCDMIIMEPKTGRILSMVSKPSFNPNIFIYGIKRDIWDFLQRNDNSPFINRCIDIQKAPLLLFRLITMYITMDRTIVDSNDLFQPCTGNLLIGNEEFKCWDEHGQLNMNDAFLENCDIFFDQLILKVGFSEFAGYIKEMNMNRKTGLDIFNESDGFLPDIEFFSARYGKKEWGNAEIVKMMSGKEDATMTLLQMTVLASAFINGGIKVTPTLIDSIADCKGNTVFKNESIKKQIMYNKDAVNNIKMLMYQNVNSDKSIIPAARIENYPIGALYSEFESRNISINNMLMFYPVEDPYIIITLSIEGMENARFNLPHLIRKIMYYCIKELYEKNEH